MYASHITHIGSIMHFNFSYDIKCALDRMEVEPFNDYRLCTCRDICSLAGFSLGNLKYIYVNIVLIVISNPFARF